MPGQAFKDAVKESKQLKAKPGQDELLQVLYYVFLQGPMLLICEFAERTKTHIVCEFTDTSRLDRCTRISNKLNKTLQSTKLQLQVHLI